MKKSIAIFIAGVVLFGLLASAEAFVGEVAKKWDAVSIAPDTDWFGTDLAPSPNSDRRGMSIVFDAPVKHTFQFSCPTATVINLQVKFNAITKLHNFNGGVAIEANDANQFSFILQTGMTYNIQHKTATQNCSVVITESFNVDL